MAPVSKHSETPKNRIARNFGPKRSVATRLFFFPKPTPARKHESESRWISKTNLICKELGLVVVYGYGFGAVVVDGRGDDDGAAAA